MDWYVYVKKKKKKPLENNQSTLYESPDKNKVLENLVINYKKYIHTSRSESKIFHFPYKQKMKNKVREFPRFPLELCPSTKTRTCIIYVSLYFSYKNELSVLL